MKKIRWDIVLILLALVCFFLYGIISYDNYNTENNADEVKDKLREINDNAKLNIEVEYENETEAEIPYRTLYEENSDMVGWLKIPDTNIDYPVMQTIEDEQYYLYRDFFGNKDKNGTLFMDTDSDMNRENSILMIHGHHMKSGAMFGGLAEFSKKEYFDKHSEILFYTKNEMRKYEIMSVFTTEIYNEDTNEFCYYKYFSLESKNEFDEYYKNIKKLSIYDTEVIAEYGDEFIVLSTCAYHTKNGRFVVVGKLIKD